MRRNLFGFRLARSITRPPDIAGRAIGSLFGRRRRDARGAPELVPLTPMDMPYLYLALIWR